MRVMDFYHQFTTELSYSIFRDIYRATVFTLFVRKGEFYTSPDFPKIIESTINKYFPELKDNYEIRILGKFKNKGLLKVTPFQPIIQIIGSGLEPIKLESLLLNVVQRELFYTTRLINFKNTVEEYFPNAKVLEFGLRRAPDIELAKRISEIAVKLGYLTSNIMLEEVYSDKITGTVPHAFIQFAIFSGEYDDEVKFWKYILENNYTDTILPDTIDTLKLLKELLPNLKINKIKIRLDSGDHTELIKEIEKIPGPERYYILSGDYNENKVKYVGENLPENLRKKVIGIAAGTQITNNTKPLSIVYKLTAIDTYKNDESKWIAVKKLAPAKKQIEGVKYYDYIENKIKDGFSPFPNDVAIY